MKNICIDLTHQKFGRLLVIKRVPNPSANKFNEKRAYWLCRCDCGKERIIRGVSLRNGNTFSCGCFRNERIRKIKNKTPGYTAKHAVFCDYVYSARARKLDFTITENEFDELTKRSCYYCGELPSRVVIQKNAPGEFVYNGLDRVDSSRGYVMDNVVACCTMCNFAKSNTDQGDFLRWVEKVYHYVVESKRDNV